MRRLWLLFSQFVTVLLALWFVVLTLKPQWPQDWQSLWQKWRSPAISLNTKGQSTAPLAQPVVGQSMSFRDAVKVAAPSVVSISTSRAADDPAAAKDPWFRFFFGEQGENADGEGEEIPVLREVVSTAPDRRPGCLHEEPFLHVRLQRNDRQTPSLDEERVVGPALHVMAKGDGEGRPGLR